MFTGRRAHRGRRRAPAGFVLPVSSESSNLEENAFLKIAESESHGRPAAGDRASTKRCIDRGHGPTDRKGRRLAVEIEAIDEQPRPRGPGSARK